MKSLRKDLKEQYENTGAIMFKKKRQDLLDRITILDGEIELFRENRKFAIEAEKEILRLEKTSNEAEKQLLVMYNKNPGMA